MQQLIENKKSFQHSCDFLSFPKCRHVELTNTAIYFILLHQCLNTPASTAPADILMTHKSSVDYILETGDSVK